MIKTAIGISKAFFCLIRSKKENDRKGVTIFLRSATPGTLDSDFFPLVQLMNGKFDRLYVIDKTGDFGVVNSWIDALRLNFCGEVILVGPERLQEAIVNSYYIFCKNASGDGAHYRFANFFLRKKFFILIPHGPTTKPYGKSDKIKLPWVLSKSESFLYAKVSRKGVASSVISYFAKKGYGKIIVQNSLEAYRKSLIYGGMELIDCRGYPRFYRARYLSENKSDAVISSSALKSVNISSINVLFAPRKKLVISDESWEKLQLICESRGIRLHVRMHPQYMSSIPDFALRSASISILDQKSVPGPVEILCYMDALVTDISSIMMEGFVYKIPVVHFLTENEEMAHEPQLALPGICLFFEEQLIDFISDLKAGAIDKNSQYACNIFRLDKPCTLEEAYSDLFD